MAFTFLVGDSGFSGASVPGASGFVTQLSATAMLGSRERERVVTEAKQQRKTAMQAERERERERRASFVPNSFL